MYDEYNNPIPVDDEDAELARLRAELEKAREALQQYVVIDRCENPIRTPLPNPRGYASHEALSNCGECRYCKALAALAPAASGENTCNWREGENECFSIQCNRRSLGGECGWNYCPYCGRRIKYTREYMPDSTTPAAAAKEEQNGYE